MVSGRSTHTTSQLLTVNHLNRRVIDTLILWLREPVVAPRNRQ